MASIPLVVTVFVVTLYFFLVWRFLLRRLPPFAVHLFVGFSLVHALLIGLYLLFHESKLFESSSFVRWYMLYTHGEFNPSATFSSAQLICSALIALSIAVFAQLRAFWHRLYWLALALVFAALTLDEYFMLHEGQPWWMKVYFFGGLVVLAASGLFHWFGLKRRDLDVFGLFVGGLALTAAGSILLESATARACFGLLPRATCVHFAALEELLENFGILTVVVGFAVYAHRHIAPGVWPKRRAGIVAGTLVCAAALLALFWVGAPLEARYLATPIQLSYADEKISVVGYRTSSAVLRGGDALKVDIYWQIDDYVDDEYGLTAQLMNPLDGQSLTRSNTVIHDPGIVEWLPQHIHRTSLSLSIPHDVPTPTSYALVLTVWEDKRPNFEMKSVTRTNLPLVTEDMVMLTTIPVIAPAQIPSIDHASDYRFVDGFRLTGYTLAAFAVRGQVLSPSFAWATGSISQHYSQFLHLFHQGNADVFTHDQPWLGGIASLVIPNQQIQTVDSWNVLLPHSLPPGDYDVYTGVYETTTRERVPVTGSDGQDLLDQRIYLGTVHLE